MIDTFVQHITIPEILKDEWFKKDYNPPVFDDKEYTNSDDVEAVFKDSEEYLMTEKKEQQPTAMNAFELISMSKDLNLGNLFGNQIGNQTRPELEYRKPAATPLPAGTGTDAFPSSLLQWLNASPRREKKHTGNGFQNWVK
ncbi:CBL-interacting serine threonine- kinase 3 isoform X1 [Olea europaea subsp. europaea]|uniref:CBL-interacting serine threonine- kinase 3 isoform X1 n=1 Tax=Olea europaea subsp. europaea TaxID=158383 RepID=A0A8S0RJ40_OLEEU|nr:CBL-interacting serine threonine- kinase 3 isoform X1 [Olea europaea subsp. europaea]